MTLTNQDSPATQEAGSVQGANALLQARNLTAGYGPRPVLHDIALTVRRGEFVGLLGPNGCGKSTLLRVLSSVLTPASGQVELDGRPLGAWSGPERARRLAFVPQMEAAPFAYTVRDLVLMGRYPHRQPFRGPTPDDFAHVRQALAQADIAALADRAVNELSGGEHRRVLLARALAQNTPLLLMDEPTASLDVTHQVEVLLLAQSLAHQQGRGVLAALHDLNQASEFCDRLVLLHEGRILAQGSPADVLTPENLLRAYGATAHVGRNPATNRPAILSLYPAREDRLGGVERVHVVCGGGSGVALLGLLTRQGRHVTTGVLNRLDSDYEAALALGLPVADEDPFSRIGDLAREHCARLMRQADTIIVTEVPFGGGNLANLELTRQAQQDGKTVVLLGGDDYAARDFAQGQAAALFAALIANGARTVSTLADLPAVLMA